MATNQTLVSLLNVVQSNELIVLKDFKSFMERDFSILLKFLKNKSLTKKCIPIKKIFIDFRTNFVEAEKILFKYISVELCLFESYLDYLNDYFKDHSYLSLEDFFKEKNCNSSELKMWDKKFISQFHFFREFAKHEVDCVALKKISNEKRLFR